MGEAFPVNTDCAGFNSFANILLIILLGFFNTILSKKKSLIDDSFLTKQVATNSLKFIFITMAKTILNLTILILLVSLALHNSHFVVSSTDIDQDHDINEEEEEEYVLDTPIPHLGPRDHNKERKTV
ncbi:hypothetical protein JHK82_037467 [Glycine max]|nr:hypothetical protein JHK82_037467 [Glycine max]